jgi:fucose permease
MSVFSCSLVPHWWGFVGSTLLTGIAMGVLDPGLNAYAATSFSARQLNWLHASFGIGITISPAVLTTLLVYDISWQWGYALIALLIAGLTVWLVKVRTCWHTSATTTTRKASRETPNFAYLLSMPMVWAILGIFFLYPLEGIVGQWTFILLTEGRAIPIGIAGFWVSIYWGMLTLGRILMGVVADRIHTKKLLRLCMIGLVAGAVCIWMPVSTEVNFFGVALMGIAVAPIYPLLIVQTPDRVDVSVVPSIVGLQSCASGLGGAMLPALAGILVDGMGIQSVGGYMVILALLMVLLHELALRIPAQPVDLKGGETTYV